MNDPIIDRTKELIEQCKTGQITSSELIRALKQYDHTWGYLPGDQWNDVWIRGSVDYIEMAYYQDIIKMEELEDIWPHLVRTFNVSKPFISAQD